MLPNMKPRAPRTLGVLSITFAGIVLFGSSLGLLGLMVPALAAHAPAPQRPEEAQAMALMVSMYRTMGIISGILLVLSALLLVVGIGQLRYRRWAAVWSVRWAIVALGALVVMAIIMVRAPAELMQTLTAAAPNPPAPGQARAAGMALGGIYAAMMLFFYAPYPFLLLALFTRPRIREAMTA
jgi:hypothetical protein